MAWNGHGAVILKSGNTIYGVKSHGLSSDLRH